MSDPHLLKSQLCLLSDYVSNLKGYHDDNASSKLFNRNIMSWPHAENVNQPFWILFLLNFYTLFIFDWTKQQFIFDFPYRSQSMPVLVCCSLSQCGTTFLKCSAITCDWFPLFKNLQFRKPPFSSKEQQSQLHLQVLLQIPSLEYFQYSIALYERLHRYKSWV